MENAFREVRPSPGQPVSESCTLRRDSLSPRGGVEEARGETCGRQPGRARRRATPDLTPFRPSPLTAQTPMAPRSDGPSVERSAADPASVRGAADLDEPWLPPAAQAEPDDIASLTKFQPARLGGRDGSPVV